MRLFIPRRFAHRRDRGRKGGCVDFRFGRLLGMRRRVHGDDTRFFRSVRYLLGRGRLFWRRRRFDRV
jgi:hypothetical protein